MAASPEQDLSTSTKLAIERTRLAHERTLMAWVRTATSLISFGKLELRKNYVRWA
jgi:uncharacterized membrane protein YidH (DUF202 family)